MAPLNRKIAIAPMMDCTDRHYRYFMRIISKDTLLYTEMLHANQILHGDQQRFLNFHASEQPLAIQLGGNDPKTLVAASKIAASFGYQEINLNVGCPSSRVQAGQFGACLMKQPELVAECVAAMKNAVTIPVTVKTRIGVDEFEDYDFLQQFIATIAKAGCHTFIIHARKAWLAGLSPKQNRTIPPLNYDVVYQLKRDFPQLEIIINGGIKSIAEIQMHLEHVDGVMLGREAYANPYLFAQIDSLFFNENEQIKSRLQILKEYFPYVEQELQQGTRLHLLTRHILGLFYGIANAKFWRDFIVKHSRDNVMGMEKLQQTLVRLM